MLYAPATSSYSVLAIASHTTRRAALLVESSAPVANMHFIGRALLAAANVVHVLSLHHTNIHKRRSAAFRRHAERRAGRIRPSRACAICRSSTRARAAASCSRCIWNLSCTNRGARRHRRSLCLGECSFALLLRSLLRAPQPLLAHTARSPRSSRCLPS